MKYPSAKSAGFTILVWGVIALLAASSVIAPPFIRIFIIAASVLTAACLLWIWFGTGYEFREDFLMLRYGPFFERIPYEKVTHAMKLKAMFSSMALSSEMIELRHGANYLTGTTFISPKDREGFLEELKKRCANLQP